MNWFSKYWWVLALAALAVWGGWYMYDQNKKKQAANADGIKDGATPAGNGQINLGDLGATNLNGGIAAGTVDAYA